MAIFYGKLRLMSRSALDGQSATIQDGTGKTIRTITLKAPYVDVVVAGLQSYYVTFNGKSKAVDVGFGAIVSVNVSGSGSSIPSSDAVIYGFKVSKSAPDPDSRVEYTDDCEGFDSAYMDYDNDAFVYGDWEDAFFMPRPCMLKYDGTVDYYLNPDDYTKKEDGTASDITNTSYNGNAMMEFPKIYVSRTEDNEYYYTKISNAKINASYNCFTNLDAKGKEIDHFYCAIYNGSNISSKLRSLSGQTPINGATGSTEITYALANNTNSKYTGNGWYIEQWCDRALLIDLCTLISKSTNSQKKFGNGHYTGGSAASSLLTTGTMNSKGLFWGTNGTGKGVKVFGIENLWANQWRRCAGLMTSGTSLYAKMTWSKADDTEVEGYQQSAVTGYKYIGKALGGSSGGYISTVSNGKFGRIPVTMSGGDQLYECDGGWFNSQVTAFALVGGASNNGFLCGVGACVLDVAVSRADWTTGAALSCKPLAV